MEKFAVIITIVGLLSLIATVAITPWAVILLILDFVTILIYSNIPEKAKSESE